MNSLLWVCCNTFLFACAYNGVNGDNQAANVFIFLTCFFTIVNLGAAVDAQKAPQRYRNRCVPEFVSYLYDVSLLAFLVWHGWFSMGAVVLFSAIGEWMTYNAERISKGSNG
jgi:hypothetical protein